MITAFHFLRPWWLLCFLPVLGLIGLLWQQKPLLQAWGAVCDSHLLAELMQTNGNSKRKMALSFLLGSALFLCISLAGPTWSRFPVPTYQHIQPRVIVLDMSEAMLATDLLPNRLTRARFKLHDLYTRKDIGQFGLVVYSGEPFVASPLTDDGKTIDELLSSLTPDIMPVEGQHLDTALKQALDLIHQAGFNQGQVLVLTAETPSVEAIATAKELATDHIQTSIMPVARDASSSGLFQQFANAGQGLVIPFSDTASDLDTWLSKTRSNQQFSINADNEIPQWRDQGRWFLIPALLLLSPVFRRGWLQRIST